MPEPGPALLQVDALTVDFRTRRGCVHAVRAASFAVPAGRTVGLVGESGSGKTTIGRAILGLVRPTSGAIMFRDQDITHTSQRARRQLAADIQVIFQDPYSSLNPARRVGATLREALPASTPPDQARQRMAGLLESVGLPAQAAGQYPVQFSGGQRQRLAIARALMASPSLIVCDEPVSALDVSIQAQVLNLLRDLQRQFSLSYLFISHDLDVVRFMADQIVVLYRGHVLEQGPADIVAHTPRSPYTQALLAAAPRIGAGLAPSAQAAPAHSPGRAAPGGCPFADRCPYVTGICRAEMPALQPTPGGGSVACHRYPDP